MREKISTTQKSKIRSKFPDEPDLWTRRQLAKTPIVVPGTGPNVSTHQKHIYEII